MFKYYLKTAWRNLVKQKVFSVINILGLAIGIAVAFLIMNYVSHEFSYDDFHKKKDRIYRVESQFYEGNNLTDDWGTSTFGYGSAMKKELPGIEDFVRISIHETEQVVKYGDYKVREDGVVFTEPSFFNIFDYKLLEGDKTTALSKVNSLVITQSAAKQFFGNESPMGKTLRFLRGDHFVDCIITGVMEDFPVNSHIHFKYLIAYEGLPVWMKDFWYLHEAYTYVLLQPGASVAAIENAFPALAEKYKTADALRSKKWAVKLVPLEDIHLNPQKGYEPEIKGNKLSLITLAVIAFVVLITAWINYVNLSTARSLERAKEVGIRKVSGAFRWQLIGQFYLESFIINIAALLLAFLIVLISRSSFNELTGKDIGIFIFGKPVFWISLILSLLAGIFLSGLYPALVLSSVKPALILKGKFANSSSGNMLQKVLVVFQFAAAMFLMIGMSVVQKQISFMHQQSLGVNIDRTIVMKYPVSSAKLEVSVAQFAERIRTMPGVKSATVAGSVPGIEVAKFAANRMYGSSDKATRLYEMLTVDYDYVDMFGLELVAGRSFKKHFGNDSANMMVNEETLKQLGIASAAEAIGKKVALEGEEKPAEIIGVVKNWHQRGLGNNYTPIMFIMNGRISWVPAEYIAVKVAGDDLNAKVGALKTIWKEYFPESSFDSFFLDGYFNQQYAADVRFSRVIAFFTALAFFITIMGVWALSAYTANKKVKEIGIRKVLGASRLDVMKLFSKGILNMVLIAFLIAVPLSYFLMKQWLNHFAFRTGISVGLYFFGAIIALLIVFITVLWQSILVNVQKPVESLRME